MRFPRLTWGGLDLGDHLVVGGRRLANELTRILRVQDYRVVSSPAKARIASTAGDLERQVTPSAS